MGYKAIGLMRGHYIPSVEEFTHGVLLTSDGSKLQAYLFPYVAQMLQRQPELLNSPQFWNVYLSTMSESPGLYLQLKQDVGK